MYDWHSNMSCGITTITSAVALDPEAKARARTSEKQGKRE